MPPVVEFVSNPAPISSLTAVTLTCQARGDPDPEVTWRSPQGHEVKVTGDEYHVENGRLDIREALNEKHGGEWICVACNVLGCDTGSTLVKIEGEFCVCACLCVCVSLIQTSGPSGTLLISPEGGRSKMVQRFWMCLSVSEFVCLSVCLSLSLSLSF